MKKKLLLLLLSGSLIVSCKTQNEEVAATPKNTTEMPGYTGPHVAHTKKYADFNFTSEAQWDSLRGHPRSTAPATTAGRHPDYKTFGWHLYSKGTAYKSYDFSLLWGVAYFSYIVHPKTGGYTNIHQWKTTALVDSAKVHDTQVFLSVSNFGSAENAGFLANKKAQQTLSDSLSVLLKLREADGINIDFEGVPATSREAFNDFVVFLSKDLKQKNPEYKVSLALYAVDRDKVFDIKTLNPHIDFYTLMSYDYYGGFSSHAGPIAPLKSSAVWGKNSVEASVDFYLNEGVVPEKLIVGIPYYGGAWEVQEPAIPAKAEKFSSYLPYNTVKEDYLSPLKVTVKFDTVSRSTYFSVETPEGGLRQVWFDDSLAIAAKYDFIKEKKLAGPAIWALDYGEGDKELWELLASRFGKNRQLPGN